MDFEGKGNPICENEMSIPLNYYNYYTFYRILFSRMSNFPQIPISSLSCILSPVEGGEIRSYIPTIVEDKRDYRISLTTIFRKPISPATNK
jgi:hypothetical protein